MHQPNRDSEQPHISESELLQITTFGKGKLQHLSSEARSLQAAYSQFGELLTQQEADFVNVAPKVHKRLEHPAKHTFAHWSSTLASTLLLCLFASYAAWQLPYARTPLSVTQAQLSQNATLTWNDDWESQTTFCNTLFLESRVTQLNLSDTAADWLQASLLSERSQMESESM